MDFLHRLAASALGDTGSLRPALPPRFAPRSSATPAGVLDAGLPPAEGEQSGHAQPAQFPDRRTTGGLLPPDAPAPGLFAPGATASALPAAITPSAVGTSLVANAVSITRSGPAEAAGPAAGASAHPHAGPWETTAAMQPLRDAPQASGPRGASAPPLGEHLAAPLEAAVVAAQTRGAAASPAPAAAPVVHVVIERIDVRAPAPAPSRPPAAPAPRAQPSASLGEYLRGAKR